MAKRMKIGVMGVGVLSLSLTLAGVGGFAPVAWADDHEAGMSEAGTTEAGTGTVQNTDASRGEQRQAKRAERRAEKKAKMKDRKETRKAKRKARQEKRQQNAS